MLIKRYGSFSSFLFVILLLCVGCSSQKHICKKRCYSFIDMVMDASPEITKVKSNWILTVELSNWGKGIHRVIQLSQAESDGLTGRVLTIFEYYNDYYRLGKVEEVRFEPSPDLVSQDFKNFVETQLQLTEPQHLVDERLASPEGEVLIIADGTTASIMLTRNWRRTICVSYNSPESYLTFYQDRGVDAQEYVDFLSLLEQLLEVVPDELELMEW